MRASVAVLVGAAALAVTYAGPAQAASCPHVTISPGVQSPTLSPKSVTIDYGGCVAYTNSTALAVKLTIGKFAAVVNPNAVLAVIEQSSGTFPVTAQEQIQGQGVGGTGNGTLVVRPKPKPKPSASPTVSGHPSPPPSSAPPNSAPPSATPSRSGPVVAPSTPASPPPTGPSVTPAPNQSGQGNPPIIVGMPPPTPTPSSSPSIVPRAQLQPPSGRAAGLPAAVAAVLIVGAAAAFMRVLLAEPVPGVNDRRFIPSPS